VLDVPNANELDLKTKGKYVPSGRRQPPGNQAGNLKFTAKKKVNGKTQTGHKMTVENHK